MNTKHVKHPDKYLISNYIIFAIIFTIVIGIFSLIMVGVSSVRNDISYDNLDSTSRIYNGPLEQSAPTLNMIDKDGDVYMINDITPVQAQTYIDNTFLTSTNGHVKISADFVKKGLTLQPTYKTEFSAEYLLNNTLEEPSFISFQFPFPVNTNKNEISNARLVVDGEEIKNAKAEINYFSSGVYDYDYDYYTPTIVNGLKWEGDIAAKTQIKIEVSYNTVGLSRFTYEGIENSLGSQDFKFDVLIDGTRSYDVIEGVSVDKRVFGDNSVQLIWNKDDLYSKPKINIAVGDKLNPSTQVSRVYLTMAPVYIVFIAVLLFLAYRFGKKLGIFDMFLMTVLFTVYFPLIHYLSSFTIDPTIEIFSGISNVGEFSMPLYGAFAIALLIIGGLMYYLLGRISGFKFSTKLGIPMIVLFIGFFPLVVTIPEYSMLLVLFGVVALIAIVVQVRINMINKKVE